MATLEHSVKALVLRGLLDNQLTFDQLVADTYQESNPNLVQIAIDRLMEVKFIFKVKYPFVDSTFYAITEQGKTAFGEYLSRID